MQDCASSNKIKENKYKILRMSLLLGADSNNPETLNNFEEASRDIDAMNDEVYLREIETKFYDTVSLEEEEKKLTVLVDYIGGRVEQRISLLSDFANVTGYDLQGLSPIKYYDKLDDYKERLRYIKEYLSNIEQINKLDFEIEEADNKLSEAYIQKGTSEEQNIKNEELLQTKFNNLLKNMEFFKDITEENVNEKLNETIYKVEDSKKSLDIFKKSFATLSNSGISEEEEKEYLSYVEGAEEAFYANKEAEYLLRIYNLLREKNSEYSKLLIKREELNDILFERINLRKELRIQNADVLNNIYDLLEKQYEDIKRQSVNMEKIDTLNSEINTKREMLNELINENQKVEILSLLREFGIIDTYEEFPSVKEDMPEEDSVVEEVIEEATIEESTDDDPYSKEEFIIPEEISTETPDVSENFSIEEETKEETIQPTKNDSTNLFEVKEDKPVDTFSNVNDEINAFQEEVKENQVISVDEPNNIDLELIHSKANKVMKRVGDMLGIKTEEEKIITVSNEEEKIVPETKKEEPKKELPKEPIFPQQEEVNQVENPLFNDNLETEEVKTNEFENPLFSDNLENTINLNIDPEFKKAINSLDDNERDSEENNDFWFPSDTPDALNELPDLEISDNNNNLFLNNNISDLQFPDLKIDFGSSDSEEK